MTHPLSQETAALIAGAGIAIGECVFGVNGPFLFERFGYNTGISALFGVFTGAVVGYGAAVTILRVLRHEKTSTHVNHGMLAHWGAHPRA
jgi:hypothetical protein